MFSSKSSNPVLSDNIFDKHERSLDNQMTVAGTMNKTLFLGIILLAGGLLTFSFVDKGHNPMTFMAVGGIVGFIFALITIFKTEYAKFTAPIYAFFEGLFIGGLSAFVALSQGLGIVTQALVLTLAVLFTMIAVYRSGLIKVNERFRNIMMVAIGGVAVAYLINFVMSFFGAGLPFIHEGGLIGIGFSLVVVGIASFSLLLDLDFIYKGAQYGLHKDMEWYGAFGLMVTLVWLYVEILRLLSKLNRD